MLTFICFTSKQYGVPTQILSMREMLVSMLTIGKILEESLISLTMKKSNVHNGKLRTSSKLMLMDAKTNIDANSHMDGKNKNITP